MTNGRVLVIDDAPEIARVIAVALTALGYRVETAACGQAGLDAAAQSPPDVVVVDMCLPDMTGFEVISALRAWSRAAIIALSASTEVAGKVLALDLGADDFVIKPFDVPELVAWMRAAARRAGRAGGGSFVHVGPWTIDLARRTASGAHGAVTLTPMEWRLLEVLARRPGRLVTQHELLSEMPAGRPHVPDSSYLRIHMMHLRQKLEPDPSRPRYLVTEPGMGFRLRP